MNVQKEKFLPIGSIVILKNATKKMMITGFCISVEGQNSVYDYSGCLYPEGIISASEVAVFNHDQIDKIFAIGYSDEEEKQFKIKLVNALANQVNNNG